MLPSNSAWSRPLGLGECFFWQMDRVVRTNFVVYAELAGALGAGEVAEGLTRLQQAHPLLRARISLESPSGPPCFVSADDPAQLAHVGARPEALQAHWLQELERPFAPGEAPLLRAHQASDGERSWVGLTLHHAIGDARVGVRLLGELLRFVAHREAPAVQPLPAPLDAHYRPSDFGAPDKRSHLGALLADLKQRAQGLPRERPLPGLCERLPQARDLRHWQRELTAPQTAALAEACRRRGTTVHGALGAAWLLALHQELFEPSRDAVLSLSTPVDLRARGGLSGSSPAMYIGAVTSHVRVGGASDLWDVARTLVDDVRQQVQAGSAHLMYELAYGKAAPSAEPAAALALQERLLRSPWSSMLTNIGLQPLPELGGRLEARRLAFVMSPLPSQLVTLSVSTSGGHLRVHAVHDAGNVAPPRAGALLERFGRLLDAAA